MEFLEALEANKEKSRAQKSKKQIFENIKHLIQLCLKQVHDYMTTVLSRYTGKKRGGLFPSIFFFLLTDLLYQNLHFQQDLLHGLYAIKLSVALALAFWIASHYL